MRENMPPPPVAFQKMLEEVSAALAAMPVWLKD